RQADQDAQQQAQQQVLQAREWDPHRAPLAEAARRAALDRLAAPQGSASGSTAAAAATCSDPTDTDGDGLTNCEEGLLGTDPTKADTDGDGLSDGQEVHGFTLPNSTTQWYSDPLEPSTINDGIVDGQKCPVSSGQPNCAVDADSDGTPDLLDRDIDGDGVPNNLDSAPLRKSNQFAAGNQMELVVNNYAPGNYIYAEFQIRPTSADHLWYAFNVLDWPDGDRAGQIQRDENSPRKTFFDLCMQQGRSDCKMAPDNNGDIKLVPMLEIEAPAQYANLPSSDDLRNYGIFAKDGANGRKYIYVPLQLVTDPTTGAR